MKRRHYGLSIQGIAVGVGAVLLASCAAGARSVAGRQTSVITEPRTASPPPPIKVVGRVTGLETSAVKANSITISPAGFPYGSFGELLPRWTTTLNPDGSFEFASVAPGPYQVVLTPSADPFPRSLIIGLSDMAVEIPMVVPSLKISGRVTNVPGTRPLEPDERIAIKLYRTDVPGGMVFHSALSPRLLVGADGSFSFDTVEAGVYELSISRCVFDDCVSSELAGDSSLVVRDRDIINLQVWEREPRDR